MTDNDGAEADQHFARVVDSLTERFAGVHDRDTVARVVAETRTQLEAKATVTNYLPVLATRRAVDRLMGRGGVLTA